MLYVQGKRRNQRPYSTALSESSDVVAAVFALFDMQWVIHSFVRGAHWQKMEKKCLESCSFMPFLVHLEGGK